MLHYIYTRPLIVIILFMGLLLILWSILSTHITAKLWRRGNLILTILAAVAILYATILNRTESSTGLILTPFAAFIAACQQPELYREMLMNVFLFLPLGLTLSNALPRKRRCWVRIALTSLVGCILSTGIEYTQYCCALGMAEVDDVICNTLGTFIGSFSLLIAYAIENSENG